MRSALQFRIVQMKLLGDLPPVLRIKVVISTTLVRRRFLNETEAGCLCYPNLFLHVISPFSGISGTTSKIMNVKVNWPEEKNEKLTTLPPLPIVIHPQRSYKTYKTRDRPCTD